MVACACVRGASRTAMLTCWGAATCSSSREGREERGRVSVFFATKIDDTSHLVIPFEIFEIFLGMTRAHRLDAGGDASPGRGRSRCLHGDAAVDGDGGELGSHGESGHLLFTRGRTFFFCCVPWHLQ